MDSFDKVVAECGILDILEDIWGILESLLFGCKLGGCGSSERPQEVSHEVLLKSDSKYRFKWKQREDFMEERIDSLDIWDNHGLR